jgi:hypothetical protein
MFLGLGEGVAFPNYPDPPDFKNNENFYNKRRINAFENGS